MEFNKDLALEKVFWSDVRDQVRKVNPAFSDVIEALNPSEKLYLYKAKYPFGATILKEGVFHLPTKEGQILTLNHSDVPQKIKEDLGYLHTIPVGIVLHNSIEQLFLQAEDRISPYSLKTPGSIFALWTLLDPPLSYHFRDVWQIVAGSRSLCMLPKIMDYNSYQKLQRARGIKHSMPKNLFDQGHMFTEIARHKGFPAKWSAEILFFPASWFKKDKSAAWANFKLFLHETAWTGSAFWRNQHLVDITWDSFVRELTHHNIRLNSSTVDRVKHLIYVGVGALPGFAPAIDDSIAPIEDFKNDFYEIYGLKFAATIIVPCHFSPDNPEKKMYWSLQMPNYLESMPKPKKLESTLSILHDMHTIFDHFRQAALQNKLKGVHGTPIYHLVKNIELDFFHSENDPLSIIQPAKIIPTEDKNFAEKNSKYKKKGFSEISPFFRGCVRFLVKKN